MEKLKTLEQRFNEKINFVDGKTINGNAYAPGVVEGQWEIYEK